jgi:hypothetical protein
MVLSFGGSFKKEKQKSWLIDIIPNEVLKKK